MGGLKIINTSIDNMYEYLNIVISRLFFALLTNNHKYGFANINLLCG